MTETALTPQTAATLAGINFSSGADQRLSAAFVNSFRISNVMEKLATIVKPGLSVDPVEFFNLCLSLSRGIDYAVANNEKPTKAQDIPLLVKQICERKYDLSLQAMVMVVMISVKNACKVGWFPEKETEELCHLVDEIGSNFCSPGDLNTVTSSLHSTVATIMERFYPRMKMGHILASRDVKPGYGIYAIDFHILKKTAHSPEEKIRLLVAQVDNLETSACLISPQQVSFIVNGRGVDKRTNVVMDTGPQLPSNVTPLLKYGTNLLQAVGQFNGHYIIVVAFMSETPLCDTPVLEDYSQPLVDGSDSDLDLIEGPSRISLNCPISYTRIKTPVKGSSCKHLQCFDFSNFISINSRRPSWRCPHCNQSVCYSDIRVDQNMVKVLKEVGKDVADVIISTDGSWKAVLENDEHLDQAQDTSLNFQKEISEMEESTSTSNALPCVLDLTEDDNDMDIVTACEIEDRKPSKANLSALPDLSSTSGVNQNVGAPVEDNFWAGLYISSTLATTAWSDAQVLGTGPQSTPATFVQAPALADVVSSTNNVQLQFMNSIPANEYGRFPTNARMVNRTPVAIQALPAQLPQAPAQQQRLRTNLNSSTPSSSAVASQVGLTPTAGFNTVYSDVERQQHISRSLINPPQATDVASVSSQHRLATQNQNHPELSFARQAANAYRSTSPLTEFQNAHLQQALNPRMTQVLGQSSSAVQSSSYHSRVPVLQQGSAQVGIPQASSAAGSQRARIPMAAAAQRVAQMARQAAVQGQPSRQGLFLPQNCVRIPTGEQRGKIGVVAQADSRADGLVDLSSEQNWRPTGRMRGSLSGRAYSSALNQFMIQPTQQTQPPQRTRPPSIPTSSPPIVSPSQLQALADRRHPSQPHNSTTQ